MVEPIDPRRLRRYLSKLHRLETWLGDHHNLSVLSEQIKAAPMPTTMREDVERLCAIIERQQLRLQHKALVLGARVYSERGQVFVNRLEDCWNRWWNASP